MALEDTLKAEWRQYYGSNPYSTTEVGIETPSDVSARAVRKALVDAGVVDRMQKESLEVFFSSASEGDIPANLVKILENDGILKQRFVVGDYAVGEKGIPTVKKVADQMGDIEYVPMVADSYKLPFANEALDVIHERMGALFHGVESGLGEVQTLIKEYARVMKRGGVLILDSTHSNKRLPSSTVKDLQKIADVGELFSDLGFELAGESGDEDEKYLILKRK